MPIRIAVLATCYNRKAKTLAALEAARAQRLPAGCSLEIFLVDDASLDGTADAVRAQFPQVQLLQGTGALFWNGGMRLAWAQALQVRFDHYVWLNDDTVLEPDAIARLLAHADRLARSGMHNTIFVGSTRDPMTGAQTYGGVVRCSRIRPLKFKLLPVSGELQRCDAMNGNCVLVTRAAAEKAGNFNPCYTHSMGDFDYGLRAVKAGCSIWVVPGVVGTCARNSNQGTWADPSLSPLQRWRQMNSPKGLRPREWREFAKLHGGVLWPLLWPLPYLRLALSCAVSARMLLHVHAAQSKSR